MKQEKLDQSAGDVVAVPEKSRDGVDIALTEQILNIMEQGILVWSAEGFCELHNSRIYDVLELSASDLSIGTRREEFRDRAVSYGEMSAEDRAYSEAQIKAYQPYSFDRMLPSGRVVLTNARPARGGSYVVTFTDVTAERRAANELNKAKQKAEAAERKAQQILCEERERQTRARNLSDLDEWLQSCKSLSELYRIVTKFMARLLPGSKGELYLYSNSRDALMGVCNWNTTDLHSAISAESCWALRRGRSYEYEVGGLCFSCDHVEDHQHEVEVNEYICVPVIAHGDTVGLLHVRFDHKSASAAKIAESAEFAIRCGEHISMAIANVKLRDELHDQSIRDPLTGLYNRRYFLEALRRDIMIADRGEQGFGLISLDADKFKAFNDAHGHDAGDMVLRAICDQMLTVMGSEATCCRMGGEEFAILMPGSDEDSAFEAAEKLRKEISKLQVRTAYGDLPKVTISGGVLGYCGKGASPNTLLKRADQALYAAKAAGRNAMSRVSALPPPGS